MVVTSALLSKMARDLEADLSALMTKDNSSAVYTETVGVEPLIPEYDFAEINTQYSELFKKQRTVKHAIHAFNQRTVLGDFGITIDEALVFMPQLTQRKNRLDWMRKQSSKERVVGYRSVGQVEYQCINYDLKAVEAEYVKVCDELNRLQTAIDVCNNTITFDVEL